MRRVAWMLGVLGILLAACAPTGTAALPPAFDAPPSPQPPLPTPSAAPACAFLWAFENAAGGCPDAPAHVFRATAQHFEHGWLLHDGAHLHVFLTAEGRPYWQIDVPPGAAAGGPAVVPPEGLHAPAAPFGEAWVGSLREHLGWAVSPPAAFDAWRQCAAPVASQPTCYLSAPDGAVYRLALDGAEHGTYALAWSPEWDTFPAHVAQ